MGSKLEKAHEGVDKTREEIDEAVEKASDDAAEMGEVREALEGVPEDTDDDILALKDTVEQSSVSEAVSDMESDVRGTLESGETTGEGVSEEAKEGEDNDREAADAYGEVSDTRFAGEAADAQSQAEAGADEFADIQTEVSDVIDEGEDEYEKYLQEIEG